MRWFRRLEGLIPEFLWNYWPLWLQPSWYEYLFGAQTNKRRPTWEMIWCRTTSHKPGIVFFNPGGLEPDSHCRGCAENLG